MTAPINVVLIGIDTLRRDHMSCYGYPRLTSPHIDRIASEGVLFRDSFSPHIPTQPGFTTMLTGVDVMDHQIVTQGGDVDLDGEIPVLPEILSANGYRTAAADNLGRWFERGFDDYESYDFKGPVDQPWRKAEAVNAAAVDLLRKVAGDPFFLFLHYWDPHTPYLPPPPFDRMFYAGDETVSTNADMEEILSFEPFAEYFQQIMGDVRDINFVIAQYDAAIAYADAAVAHVVTALQDTGAADRTLVIITSDHGEVLGDHTGQFDHHGLYDANLAVPLIMRLPGVIPQGRHARGTVSALDLAPTVLDILGTEPPRPMQGRSLLRLATGTSRITRDELYLTECTWQHKRGLRRHGWKLIQSLETDLHDGPEVELYDLSADAAEQVNVADIWPAVVSDMADRIERWVRRRKRQTAKPDPLDEQSITLREIKSIKTAVPDDQTL